MLKILYTYIQSIIVYLFNAKVKQKDLYIVGASLFKKYEFRLNENDRKSVLLIFKLLKRLLIRQHFSEPKRHSSSNTLIFDGDNKSRVFRSNYVSYYSNETDLDFLGLNECIYSYNKIDLGIQFLSVFVLSVILFPITLIPKLRIHVALLPTYFLESYGFLRYCIKHKINKVHYFCIYEANANINALLLNKHQIYCNKVPSEVPLYFHNAMIYSDELSTCFAYQEEEVKFFEETMSIEKVSNWGPEHIVDVIKSNNIKVEKSSLGFYSSGVWLRSLKGNFTKDSMEEKIETQILKTLIEFVKQERIKPVVVFLHPSERKNPEQLTLTQAYYEKHFDLKFIEFADVNVPSNQQFKSVNIGVSFFSTIVFERLYLGYKTIIAPFQAYQEFPIPNSPIHEITVRDSNSLMDLLNQSLKLSNDMFFNKFQMSHYPSKQI